MAEEPEQDPQEPNLELPPLLGFGRKKKARKAEAAPEDAVPGDDPLDADPVPPPASAPPSGPTAGPPPPRAAGTTTGSAPGGLAPSAGAARRRPPVPPPTRTGTPPPARVTSPPPPSAPAGPPADEVALEPTTRAIPVATAAPRAEPALAGPAAPPPRASVPSTPDSPPETITADAPPRARRTRSIRLPLVDARVAAVVTGVLVGLVTVVLAYLSSRGCESVRGVGSCGGFGVLALLVIVAVDVLLGAALLRAWRLTDPTSTAFLGVGLMAVFVLLFLLGALASASMLLVIPLVSAVAFLISRWVTTTFVEDDQQVMR